MRLMLAVLIIFSLNNCSNLELKLSSPPVEKESVRLTCYWKGEDKWGDKSALGGQLIEGEHCAADWSIYPVNTKIKWRGEIYEVLDYGGGLIGAEHPTIDIYYNSYRSSRKHSTRVHEIEVIEWGSIEESIKILKPRRHLNSKINEMYNSCLKASKSARS